MYKMMVYLMATLLIAAVVYALISNTVYIEGCLYMPGAYIRYSTSGAPFYIIATLTDLIRYDDYYCRNPTYAFSYDQVYLEVFASGASYFERYGRCVELGESVSLNVDASRASEHGTSVVHGCTSVKSYYVTVKYTSYYD